MNEVAIYLRTNKSNKKDLSKQEKKVRDFCRKHNLIISEIAYDLNTKQGDYKQGLEDLIISLNSTNIPIIIVEGIHILANTNADLYDMFKYAKDNGISFICADQKADIVFNIEVYFEERHFFFAEEVRFN